MKKNRRKLLCMFLICCMTVCSMFLSGCGTKEKPADTNENGEVLAGEQQNKQENKEENKADLKGAMKIKSADDLLKFAKKVNEGDSTLNALLMEDIDLSSVCGADKGSWVGIGASFDAPYDGVFDGNGHTISKLYSVENETSESGAGGLFQIAGENSVIRNLNLKDVTINRERGGCIVRESKGVIDNCHVTDGMVRGGIVGGLASNASTIKNSSFSGEVNGRVAAGIVWMAELVENCTNEGLVNCLFDGQEDKDTQAAGIVGTTEYGVMGCTNTGTVIGNTAAGIVAKVNYDTGSPEDAKVEDCRNTGRIVGRKGAGGIADFLGKKTIVNRCGNEGAVYAGLVASGIANSCREQIMNSFHKGVIEVGPDEINQRLEAEGCTAFADVDGIYYDESTAAGIVCMGNRVMNCYSQGTIISHHAHENNGEAYGIMSALNPDDPCVAGCYTTVTMDAGDMKLGIGRNRNITESFYSEQSAEHAYPKEEADFAPTPMGSFTDGTVTDALNAWVSQAGSEFSAWKQGTDGPCFEWE